MYTEAHYNNSYTKPHQNLPIWCQTESTINTSNIIHSQQYNDINNDLHNKDIKLTKQREVIKDLKKKITSSINQQTQEDVSSIKGVIYDGIGSLGNQLSSLESRYQMLQIENKDLKEALHSKEEILYQFQEVVLSSTEKFKQLETANESLRNQIQKHENAKEAIKSSIMMENEKEVNSLMAKIDNIEREKGDLVSQLKQYQQKDIETNALYESFKDIQQEIQSLEENYSKTIEDKGKDINDLRNHMQKFHDENRELTRIVEETAKKNEMLQYRVNLLEKEKEILLQEKSNDHQEIIYLRQNYQWDNCGEMVKERNKVVDEENMVEIFKKKESQYMNEITTLHGIILDRENEIETIKQKLFKKIHDVSIEKERLEMRLHQRAFTPKSPYRRDITDRYLHEKSKTIDRSYQ